MKFSLTLTDLSADEVRQLLTQVGGQVASAFPAQPSPGNGGFPQGQTLQPGPAQFNPPLGQVQQQPPATAQMQTFNPPAQPAQPAGGGMDITPQHIFSPMQNYIATFGADLAKALLTKFSLPLVITQMSAPQLHFAKAAFETGLPPDKLGIDPQGQLIRVG
jgi:hypothetical protein